MDKKLYPAVCAVTASDFCRYSVSWLEKDRLRDPSERIGPPWYKDGGHIMYPVNDLIDWMRVHVASLPSGRKVKRAQMLAAIADVEAIPEGIK